MAERAAKRRHNKQINSYCPLIKEICVETCIFFDGPEEYPNGDDEENWHVEGVGCFVKALIKKLWENLNA